MSSRHHASGRRIAVVTGIGRPGQVGEAVARAFVAAGDDVVVVGRTLDEVRARAIDIAGDRGTCTPYACDLADADAVRRLADAVRAAHGTAVDALVHAAGGWVDGAAVADAEPAYWERSLQRNLLTAAFTARAFLPLLRTAGGSVVFFASEAVLPGARVAGMSAYAAAKAGVVALTRAIAQEEGPRGVRANVLAPGAMRTAANLANMGPGASWVEIEDVVSTIRWLCSDAAAAVNGEVLHLAPGAPPPHRERADG